MAAINTKFVFERFGGPDVLKVVEAEIPQPAAGEARIKILTAGVSLADVQVLKGLYPDAIGRKLPNTPGCDLVGTIDAINGASALKVGQMVAALTTVGGYAQYICLPLEKLITVPDGLDPAEAVSLVMNYTTAYQMLIRVAKVKEGERILVHGAAGGVGSAILQLGRMLKLTLYGTASSGKQELVRSLGATPIDYKKENFTKRLPELASGGVDVVFDHIGGAHLLRSYRVLRTKGRLVAYGVASALSGRQRNVLFALFPTLWRIGLLKVIPDGKRVISFRLNAKTHPDWFREDLTTLFGYLSAGRIKPLIGARLPLKDAAQAMEHVEKADVTGKVVLVCNL